MEKQIKIKVFGKVQGVYFRQSTRTKAQELGICGVVLNEDDGSVYIEARGTEESLELFVIFCKIGPPSAEVSNVIIEESDLALYKDFRIVC